MPERPEAESEITLHLAHFGCFGIPLGRAVTPRGSNYLHGSSKPPWPAACLDAHIDCAVRDWALRV